MSKFKQNKVVFMSISLKTDFTSSSAKGGVVQIGREVFGSSGTDGVFPKRILDIICRYIPYEASQIDPTRSLFRSFVDFSSSETLKFYIAPSLRDKSDLSVALSISKEIYEGRFRYIRQDQKYGMAFPMDAEVLAYAMKRIGKRDGNSVVCELACASGENGLLLAYAGAKEVIFNDIDSGSIATLKSRLKSVSAKVKKACTVIEGNCLDLLKSKPTLENRVDLLLCRNLLHFFNSQERIEFLELITKMLKSGGQAIFTVNSVYGFGEAAVQQQLDQCEGTAFELTHCLVYDRTDTASRAPFSQLLFQTYVACSEELVDQPFKEYYIYERDFNTGRKWQVDNTEFNKLNPVLKKKTRKAIAENGKKIAKIERGAVKVLITHARAFNPTNLKQLFERQGFNAIELFLVNQQGHLLRDWTQAFSRGQQLGIVVKKP